MIKKIEIKGKLAERITDIQGDKVFEFKPGLNLLVGSNGSGKSTVLRAIRDQMTVTNRSRKNSPSTDVVVEREGDAPVLYFSGEENGTRMKSVFDHDTDMMHQIQAIYSSRGQALGSYIVHFLKKHTATIRAGAVVLLDEPDASMDWPSLTSIPKLVASVPQAQFIIACHHPLLALQPANVIELTPGYCEQLREALDELLYPESES